LQDRFPQIQPHPDIPSRVGHHALGGSIGDWGNLISGFSIDDIMKELHEGESDNSTTTTLVSPSNTSSTSTSTSSTASSTSTISLQTRTTLAKRAADIDVAVEHWKNSLTNVSGSEDGEQMLELLIAAHHVNSLLTDDYESAVQVSIGHNVVGLLLLIVDSDCDRALCYISVVVPFYLPTGGV
jgi:hypothetical protein